jgi:WD40 repeat protein
VAFASTGRDLISGALDGSLLITHEDGPQLALQAIGGIDAVGLLPDGRAVASDAQRRLRVYSTDGAVQADIELPVRVMSLRHDGARMVALPKFSEAAPPLLIDLESHRIVAELKGHTGRVFSARWVSGKRIVTAGADGTARLWDGVAGRSLQVYRGGSRFLGDATLMSESMVIAGDGDGLLRFWDAASGARLWTMQAHKSAVVGVHIEDGDLVTRGFTGEISRWRLPGPAHVLEACSGRPHCAIVAQ